MQQFEAHVEWRRGEQVFADNRYSRAHRWQFDGGLTVPASSSPLSVPVPMSDAGAVDPEEALVAAVSSCHMLFFLSFAARRGFIVDSYSDKPVGTLDKNADGQMAMTLFTLRPAIVFSGERRPGGADVDALHHEAHAHCYVANSIKADVLIEGAG